eukprot:TRINITY_DN49463_c0_g1_i1.p1 TRINITY_DN49463_c0_g1~~TRINITY_DN49463_c0_g1_i1.p1  ORF type:complete len:377 (+),score=67.41 TRINITY_DN49463_c0_g1_i1:77-1207(+)
MPVAVAINGIGGELCHVEGQPSWSIEDIRAAVEEKCDIPALEQRFFFKGAEIPAGRTLAELLDAKSEGTGLQAELSLIRRSPEGAEWIHRIKINVLSFPKAPESLRGDREAVLLAVQQKGEYLKFAADHLRQDREIVLAAITADGTALQYAADEFRSDRSVVLASFKSFTGWGFNFASEAIRADHDVALAAVSKSGMTVQLCLGEAKESLEIALAAVNNFPEALDKVAAPFQNNRDVVLAAVAKSGIVVRYASEELRADREIMLAACRSYNEAFQYASQGLKSDRDMVLAVLEISKSQLKFASEELQREFAPPALTWAESAGAIARDVAGAAGHVGLVALWAGNALVSRYLPSREDNGGEGEERDRADRDTDSPRL